MEEFHSCLCLAGVGRTLLDIPSLILHLDVTELCGAHPAGLRTLFPISGSFLSLSHRASHTQFSAPVTDTSNEKETKSAARSQEGWGTGSLGRMASPAESCSTQHPLSPGTVPTQTPGSAEGATAPQALPQCWEHTVFILHSPAFVSMDCWLLDPSRKRTKSKTLLPSLQVHLEGQPKLAMS